MNSVWLRLKQRETNTLTAGSTADCSPETLRMIDKKVVEIVSQQHEKAKKLLTDNIRQLNSLANFLYQKETITGEEFMSMLEEIKPQDAE